MPRYPYRDLGTKLNRDFRNNLNANFDDIEADIRELYDGVDDLDTRIDNIVADVGNSNTEIVDARYDAVNNVTYPTLKDRLDDTSNKIGILSTELNDSHTDSVNNVTYTTLKDRLNSNSQKIALIDFVEYGKVKLPSDFPFVLDFDLFRDFDGRIKHNFDLTKLKTGFPSVYIDRKNGNSSNDGLTESTPVSSLKRALEIANSLPDNTVNIVFMNKWVDYGVYGSAGDPTTWTLNKNINLVSKFSDGSYIFTGNPTYNFTWTLETGTVYKTTRSAAQQIFDYKFKDFRGRPRALTKVNTLAECQSKRGTWYTNGSTVYVNRLDGSAPDEDVAILLPMDTQFTFNINGYTLFFDNVHFWMYTNTITVSAISINGDANSRFIANKSSACYAKMNGFAVQKVGKTYMFECDAFENGYDGFNYHGNLVTNPYEFVFEYNCYAYNNGAIINGTGNATTAHDGMTVLRVGSVGHDCYGPVLADVNGCYSVNIDCIMYNSLRSSSSTKAAFYFDEAAAVKQGKAYLINCGGGGADYSISSDGNVDIYVKNFRGKKINSNTILNFL